MTWVAAGSAVGTIAGGLLSKPGGGGTQQWIGRETAKGIQAKNGSFNDLWGQASNLGTDPTQYVAGMNPLQMQAIKQIQANQGMGQSDYADLMAQLKGFNANPVAAGNLSTFMNPYTDAVVNRTLSDLDLQRQRAITGNGSNAEMANAYGGTRQAVTDSLTNAESFRNSGNMDAQLRDQGYTNAQQAQQQDFANRLASRGTQLTGNGQLANLIAARRSAAGGDAAALYGAGTDLQSNDQAMKDWALRRLGILNTISSSYSPAGGAVPNQPSGFTSAMGGAMAGGQMGGNLASILSQMFGPSSDQKAVNSGVNGIYQNLDQYMPTFNHE